MVKGETVTAETLTDIKILIQEFLAYHFSNGIATGYRRTGYPPPGEIHKNVAIGKYIYRHKAIKLPKFIAMIRPFSNQKDWYRKDMPSILVEEKPSNA